MCPSLIESYDKQTLKERGLPNENLVYLLNLKNFIVKIHLIPYILKVQTVHNRSPETKNY